MVEREGWGSSRGGGGGVQTKTSRSLGEASSKNRAGDPSTLLVG